MSVKTGNDGNVHNYFSPYASPYAAFMNYMNVLTDLSLQVEKQETNLIDNEQPILYSGNKQETVAKMWKPEALIF